MAPPPKPNPREFGEELRRVREASGLSLDAIAERTKIQARVLAALEDGEFGRLPNQVFARMFLRQYLELVGAAEGEWLPAFEVAWHRFAESSQTYPVGLAPPIKRRRIGPWAVGLALVAAAVVGVVLLERREGAVATAPMQRASSAARGPEHVAAPVETPVPITSTAAAPDADGLVVRGLEAPCWVEVSVAGGTPSSRLLAAGATWEVNAGGQAVDIVVGDAGAVSLAYLGETRDPVGRRGEVAHVHLSGRVTPGPVQP